MGGSAAGRLKRPRPSGNSRRGKSEVEVRDEVVDTIAGFALFADLTTPQLEQVARTLGGS